jgi:carboxyl-terminal processing protease
MTHSTAFVARRYFPRLFVIGLLLAAASPLLWADPIAPSKMDHHVAQIVAIELQREHLSKHPLDKEISERCLTLFLKTLDPRKDFFYQSDIDTFDQSKDQLAEMAKKGDLSFAYTVFKVFMERVEERVKMVDQLLATPLDFTVDEELVVDKDKITYARTPAEALEKWRKRVKYDLLVAKLEKSEKKDTDKKDKDKDQDKDAAKQPNAQPEQGEGTSAKAGDKTDGKDAIEKESRRYHSFAKRMHQTDGEELLEMFLTALSSSLDPHTNYMSPTTLKNFTIAMSLKLEGIGAALQTVDGYTVVKDLLAGGVAEKDGRIKVEDKIVAVGQDDSGEMVDTMDMKIQDVVKMIRGKAGTTVQIGRAHV